MKVTDYIVEFFIKKGVTDVFGYPGGMVTHLMDSFSKYKEKITVHAAYHEQAASFEACGYAQVSGKVGVAYATSGPGATNLVTGVCNAYFDSIPVIFLTGQVNTFESKGFSHIRQRGFQETDIVGMVKGVTKYATYVDAPEKVQGCLEQAYQAVMEGRKGPALLDIPMDIQKAEIEPTELINTKIQKKAAKYPIVIEKIKTAEKPCIILGAGLKGSMEADIAAFVEHMQIPVVTSMVAMDLMTYGHPLYFGFIGAYGSRAANFITAKCDLVFILGSRMSVRQAGKNREAFAPEATVVRVDVDQDELAYQIREEEIDIHADVWDVIQYLMCNYKEDSRKYDRWRQVCSIIREKLRGWDDRECNLLVDKISRYVPEGTVITTDVGQNQVWIAQSYRVKKGQQILFSGGHGAMGYSLPAAIGAYYAHKMPVVCFNGDGGIQMNIQELEFIRREKLPIKIFVLNNYALGMIRHFQEMYFGGNYMQTVYGAGYEAPDFESLSKAYGIMYVSYDTEQDISNKFMQIEGPVLIEVKLKGDTYVYPKLEFGKANQNQEPLIDRRLYRYIMDL
ncbi:MAG: thiamine pyrophosphate-binding protein [Eubacterium sp.]|nr:thiamine pyrophosphate-binding protein [Eubacterium sp.]